MIAGGSGLCALVIRPAEARDAEALAALSGQLGYPSSARQMGERLEQIQRESRHAVLVAAEADGAVVGWVHVCVRPLLIAGPQAEIEGLVVDQDHRRQEAGQRLLAAAEQWARANGCELLHVRSNVLRAEAHDFYPAVGYQHFKTQRAYRKKL